MEGLVCKASRLGPSPTDKGAPLWGFSSENHMIKSAFRENTLAMAQRIDWRRESTRGKSGRRLWREDQGLGRGTVRSVHLQMIMC